MKVKTNIRKTENGHQVQFTIGNQTFSLEEVLPEKGIEGYGSKKHCKWYERQLKIAFKKLKK